MHVSLGMNDDQKLLFCVKLHFVFAFGGFVFAFGGFIFALCKVKTDPLSLRGNFG